MYDMRGPIFFLVHPSHGLPRHKLQSAGHELMGLDLDDGGGECVCVCVIGGGEGGGCDVVVGASSHGCWLIALLFWFILLVGTRTEEAAGRRHYHIPIFD